jgi:transcriptional regulator with XRE-family HTH domain
MTNAFVSAQIKALKEDRELTQEQIAELIGTQQSGVSRLLRSDYSAWNVDTLRRLARAFGVRLCIRFEEFGTLLTDVSIHEQSALATQVRK